MTPDDSTRAELDKAFLDHKVLFFRDQHITTEQHVEFCRGFGELEIHPFVPCKPGYPEVMVLTHDESRKGHENAWHSDVTWRQEPSLGSMLRAVEVPDVGGDTLFADMEAAFEGLGPAMQEMCSSLTAVHDFTRVFGGLKSADELAELREKYPPAEHPVIRTHPVTGRKSIYVNVAFTSHIVGLRPDESTQLLRHLYRQAVDPRAPVPVPVGDRLARPLGQPLRPALRGQRLLAGPSGDGAGHHRRGQAGLTPA